MSIDQAASASNQSHYAQALARGYRHLEAASGYFSGTLDEQAVLDRLHA